MSSSTGVGVMGAPTASQVLILLLLVYGGRAGSIFWIGMSDLFLVLAAQTKSGSLEAQSL
jgi:hypothetical protein